MTYNRSGRRRKLFSILLLVGCLIFSHPISGAIKHPNETTFKLQWGLNNTGKNPIPSNIKPKAGIDINSLKMWSSYQSKRDIIVAIIDTGIDYKHKDLKSIIWTNPNATTKKENDDDSNGYAGDIHGWNFFSNSPDICSYSKKGTHNPKDNDNHGTLCAGVIGAVANDKTGVYGVASNINIKIMPLKVVGGPSGRGNTSAVVEAIRYAEKKGAVICNISLNSDQISYSLEQAIRESNMLIVCSAGNTSPRGVDLEKKPSYPASFDLPNLITVSGVQADGKMYTKSNYGKKAATLAAPGVDIYSTLVGNRYGYASGTSMSAAFVTGVAAVAHSANPKLYSSELKKVLELSTQKLPSLKNKTKTGGMIDGYKAVKNAKAYRHKYDTTAPKIIYKTQWSNTKEAGTITVNITDAGSSGLRYTRYCAGERDISYFQKGDGYYISNNTIRITEKGVYTIFAEDHAGNTTLCHVTVP